MSGTKFFPQVFEGSSTKFATVNDGLQIAYEDSGELDRPLILCVPGIGDVRQQFRFLAPLLCKAGYRVIITDIRGAGDSSPNFKSYGVRDQAADILAVLDAEKITKPVVLVGNSFAAASLSIVAADGEFGRPTAVAGLVTLGGFFRPMPADSFMGPLSYLLFPQVWGTTSWIGYYQTLYKTPPTDLPAHIRGLTASLVADKRRVSAIGSYVRASKADAWTALTNPPGIVAPTLLIMGADDPDFAKPDEEVELVKKAIADARGSVDGVSTLIVKAAGHYAHIEQPQIVLESVISFLKSIGF